MHRGGARATFTVRKVSFGQGVERIFPLHSPIIDKIDVVRTAQVRRAKLYFLRELKGKAARMKEQKRPTAPPELAASGELHGQGPRVPHAGERHPAHGLHPRRRRGRGRPRLPGRPGRGGGGRARSRPLRRRGSATRRRSRRSSASGSTISITRTAVAWGVASADCDEIDTINIHQASLRAMQRAVLMLAPSPDFVLVDAFRIPDLLMAQRAVDPRRHAAAPRSPRPRSSPR